MSEEDIREGTPEERPSEENETTQLEEEGADHPPAQDEDQDTPTSAPDETDVEVAVDDGPEGEMAQEDQDAGAMEGTPPEEEEAQADGEGLQGMDSEELGLSITDDELWDEGGGLDEIPLFDEIKGEEKEEGDEDGSGEEVHEAEAMPSPPEGAEEGKDVPLTKEDGETGDEEADHTPDSEVEKERDLSFYVPIVISTFNVLLFFFGILVLVNILHEEPDLSHATLERSNPPASVQAKKDRSQKAQLTEGATVSSGDLKEIKGKRGFYTMTLDPFIIPAQLNGELVFFKLKAELVFEDVASKRVFSQKESTLRDIIYSELKGIDISSGLSNKSLFSYRRPIIERLNKTFSPYKVTDIRLVGFVLK